MFGRISVSRAMTEGVKEGSLVNLVGLATLAAFQWSGFVNWSGEHYRSEDNRDNSEKRGAS